jgi:hypothetical protein
MSSRLDPRHTIGRIFGADWTLANVAKLLRFNAGQGVLPVGPLSGASQESNQDYLRRTAARHIPSGTVVSLRRDTAGNWYAELCFAGLDDYFSWNDEWAEAWLNALFPADRARVREVPDAEPDRFGTRRFVLPAQS